MTTYTFYEPGSIPGIPGTFANCRVQVNDVDGSLAIGPLDSSGFMPTITSTLPDASIEAVAPPPVVEDAAPVPPAAPLNQYGG